MVIKSMKSDKQVQQSQTLLKCIVTYFSLTKSKEFAATTMTLNDINDD